jgi:hypothetical protein
MGANGPTNAVNPAVRVMHLKPSAHLIFKGWIRASR